MLFLPIQKFTEAAKRCETSASTFSTRLRIVSFKTPAFKKQHMAFHSELQVEGVKAKSYCARHPSRTASCHCHNEGSRAQTKACATLGLCDLRGTLRQCDHLRPYSKTIFGATAPRAGLRGTASEPSTYPQKKRKEPRNRPSLRCGAPWRPETPSTRHTPRERQD